VKIGKPAVGELAEALDDSAVDVRAIIAQVLEEIGA